MTDNKLKLTITKDDKKSVFEVRKGLGLLAATMKHKIPIEFDCKKADCGICIVSVVSGMENLSQHTDSEKDFLKAMHADDNERLSCQCRVFGDIELKNEF